LTYPSEKYEFVSWDDYPIHEMENKECLKPPTSQSCGQYSSMIDLEKSQRIGVTMKLFQMIQKCFSHPQPCVPCVGFFSSLQITPQPTAMARQVIKRQCKMSKPAHWE
jgi:hypothetical protein